MNHARLSASAAHRWMRCPASLRLSAGVPRTSTVYAAQGTVAHSIAAGRLQTPDARGPQEGDVIKEDGHLITVDAEMLEGVKFYVDFCLRDAKTGDTTWTEVDLTPALSKLHPDLGGNADRIRFRPETGELRVIDFKYGAGKMVSAVANEQLMLYALGAILHIGDKYKVRTVVSTIVQPRIESEEGMVRDYAFPVSDILDFVADIQDAAQACADPNAEPVPGEAQCQWCPAKFQCPALKKYEVAVMASAFDVQTYQPAELAKALDMLGPLEDKIKFLREFAYTEALAGRFGAEHGYKIVDKRPARKWTDEKAVIEWVTKEGGDPFSAPEILSPAQMEKKLGTKKAKGLAPFIEFKSSGTVLVPVTDKRPAANLLVVAADFEAIPANDNLLEFNAK